MKLFSLKSQAGKITSKFNKPAVLLATLGCLALSACTQTADQQEAKDDTVTAYPRLKADANTVAPVADKKSYTAQYHDFKLSDDYNWLKDKSYPEINDEPVLDYLKEENAYFESFIKPHQALVDTLFEEYKGREDDEETSVPWVKNGYQYRWYFEKGAEYRTWVRKALTGDTTEHVILDEAVEAKSYEFYKVADISVSPNNQYLAWSVDTNGSERFTIYIKDLKTGELLKDTITQTSGDIIWANDSKTLLYVIVSEEWRPFEAKAHVLGTDNTADKTLYKESDIGFFVGIDKSHSGDYLVIRTASHTVAENYVVKADAPLSPLTLMASRDKAIDYYVDHAHGDFYIRTNDQHVNFHIAKTKDTEPTFDNWQTLIAPSDEVYFTGLLPLKNTLVVQERKQGLDQVRLFSYQGEQSYVAFPEAAYSANLGNNPEFDQNHIRINYESMVTPESVLDYQFAEQKLVTKKERNIPSGYDKSQYQTERLWAPARDGAKIPISIVYKKGFKRDGSQPVHLYAYGAYGLGMSANFSTINLSLLDRGFAYAIAHIRGGDEMGYQWYLDGKLEKRQNTFNDFIDSANFLIEQQYTSKGNISISGRSAGGELMGVVTVQAPELWRSVILGVPFVDVLNTMLDDTLPLTPIEWPEWGNPIKSAKDYQTILAYSPYDNIEKRDYPPMMVTGGLNDPRVTYWEPAKWTAKMREYKTDDNLLVMRMHMGAGHFSSSGRYARLLDYAQEFAFMLKAHGINK
ncbi:S9 family peptidase [Catenovulum sp. SM1970]|uniref:S9 family peptidase n=1 Tax=Marinifaba aquimaris TaxID=2741323 RepID=UPI0015722FAC|nr:S9 family peptidase [Marinifaba aquimaris]NTS77117.1 S9 family peptidase [Marinifaba aquimaris]